MNKKNKKKVFTDVLYNSLIEISRKDNINDKYIDYFLDHMASKGEIEEPQEGTEDYSEGCNKD